jgi:hypothetical protein
METLEFSSRLACYFTRILKKMNFNDRLKAREKQSIHREAKSEFVLRLFFCAK